MKEHHEYVRLALVPDAHDNLSVPKAVLAALNHQGSFDALICAGELVCLGISLVEMLERLVTVGVLMVDALSGGSQ